MSDLLTARQVQDLLKVDRTTVYRMLNDGRLTGVKIGQQWRFHRQEVDALLSGEPAGQASAIFAKSALPLPCIQAVQDVFADLGEIGAITTSPNGQPLTESSNCCAFCHLILSSPSGRQACMGSWKSLAEQSEHQPHFASCHAGLQYARARIELKGELAAMLVAGQFYAEAPDPQEEARRIQRLAHQYGIDADQLAGFARALPILDERKRAKISLWLEKVAHTFEDISRERGGFLEKLRQIATISAIET